MLHVKCSYNRKLGMSERTRRGEGRGESIRGEREGRKEEGMEKEITQE